MSVPLVSIGVPTYNRAAFLRQSLEMIRAQDYPNLEINISDNHSDDDTEHVCRKAAAADPRIRYHRQPRNIGLHANLNFCFDQARGEFLCLFMDDDQYASSIVSEYVAFLTAHPEVGLVCSDYELLDQDGQRIGVRDHRVPEVMPGLDYIDRTIRSGRSAGVGCPGMMVRRSALGRIRFDEDSPIGFGDYVVWFRVAESSAVGHIARRLWRFRTHRKALSTRPVHSIARDYEEQILAYCDDHLMRWPTHRALVERWRAAMWRYLFWALVYELALDARSPVSSSAHTSRHQTVFEISRYCLSPGERSQVWGQLRRYRSGVGQALVYFALDFLLRLRMTAPFAWASRHSESFRAILGLR